MNTLVISSGGVSPSNREARFPNLARHEKDDATKAEVAAQCRAELEAAGIEVVEMDFLAERGEVPSRAIGQVGCWGFERAWYYWRAKGPGIPPVDAEALHATHGREVRVDGHCGCPSPLEWHKGFAVGSYHVDSPEGLKALTDLIKSIYARTEPKP